MADTATRTDAPEITKTPKTELATATPLDTEHGRTTIADGVVAKVAGLATREVPGIHDLGGGAARVIGSVTGRVGRDQLTQGVSVEVGTKEAAIDLVVVVEYGENIPQVTEAVRDNVIQRIRGITGLEVTEVNINVTDLHFAGEDESSDTGASRVQ